MWWWRGSNTSELPNEFSKIHRPVPNPRHVDSVRLKIWRHVLFKYSPGDNFNYHWLENWPNSQAESIDFDLNLPVSPFDLIPISYLLGLQLHVTPSNTKNNNIINNLCPHQLSASWGHICEACFHKTNMSLVHEFSLTVRDKNCLQKLTGDPV